MKRLLAAALSFASVVVLILTIAGVASVWEPIHAWAGSTPKGGKCTQDSDCSAPYHCQGINEKVCE